MHLISALGRASLLAVQDSAKAPLWAQLHDVDDPALPFWKAALIAFALELLIPLLIFAVDWSALRPADEPPPIPVMSVRLEAPPPELQPPPPPQVKPKEQQPTPVKRVRKRKPAIAMEPPPPQPNDAQGKIQIPKPEPELKPEPPKPEKKPEPLPEPEAPPLPSVFRDVKPVKKVRPVYPPEAEQQHIQGRVKVRLNVDLDGNVTDVQVLLAEPPGVFEESVLTAVRQYKFKRDGTTYQADQEVIFKIDD